MKKTILALGVLALMAMGCNNHNSTEELEKACVNGTLNVLMFGAKGDGVTDGTQAIQSVRQSTRFLIIVQGIN